MTSNPKPTVDITKYPTGAFQISGYRVVIEEIPVGKKSKGGIILAVGDELDRMQGGQTIGIVVAIGGLAFTNTEFFAEGDRDMYPLGSLVMHKKYGGYAWKLDSADPNATRFRTIPDTDVIMLAPENLSSEENL